MIDQFLYNADRWVSELHKLGPQAWALLIPLVFVAMLEGKMLQDGLKHAKVENPSLFLAMIVAMGSLVPCIVIGLLFSFIPVLGWILSLVLSFALVGGICAVLFRCRWGQGFYAAFWWWLYHVIFLIVIGVVLLVLAIAVGISVFR